MNVIVEIYFILGGLVSIAASISYSNDTGVFTLLDLIMIPLLGILWLPLLIYGIFTEVKAIKHFFQNIGTKLNTIILYKTRKTKLREILYQNMEDEE
jgi:hypothetical protein